MNLQISEISKVYDTFQKDIETLDPTQIKSAYLSKDGHLTQLLTQLRDLPKEQKAQFGAEVNLLKTYINEHLTNSSLVQTPLKLNNRIDPTAPFDINTPLDQRPQVQPGSGSQHPLTKELEHVMDIFESMGFTVEDSRQLDNDYNMFESLNFPQGHPARDLWDTFWTEEGFIPPAHTSTMQNRTLKKYEPPIRVVVPGRCFRNEATDASHEHTLHQIEGVYVDKDINLGHMLGTIKTYLEAFFGQKLEVKVQPAYFPFTEPGMEFLISCPFCSSGCSVCGQTRWIEAMGCGMIHPNVLREGGIDPEIYTGFAWGFGLDRLVMIKNGIQDIRWLQSGSLRFIKQF